MIYPHCNTNGGIRQYAPIILLKGVITMSTTSRDMKLQKSITPPVELKECPFCGDVGILVPLKVYGHDAYMVTCLGCHARSLFEVVAAEIISFEKNITREVTHEEAKTRTCIRWNRRKEGATA